MIVIVITFGKPSFEALLVRAVECRASNDQAEMYSNQQQKAEFLQSVMGKGILLLSLSMIKYSWYTVMKQV